MSSNIKRDKSYPFCGRLIVLQSLGNRNILDVVRSEENFQGFTAINFPSMPDGIDLARRADYSVSSPFGFPDGIHMYKGTAPLKVPVSFKLHFSDKEYCPKGAKTVLEVAAILESLVLPFGPADAKVVWGIDSEKGQPTPGDDASVKTNAQESLHSTYNQPDSVYPPATCYLELIRTEHDSVGLCCVGYVEDVKVRLLGPWMRGPGFSQNLPTAGEFDFTFVHHPGHGNAFNQKAGASFSEQQAYAGIVKDRLFNTVGLLTNPNNFFGYNDNISGYRGKGAGGSW